METSASFEARSAPSSYPTTTAPESIPTRADSFERRSHFVWIHAHVARAV